MITQAEFSGFQLAPAATAGVVLASALFRGVGGSSGALSMAGDTEKRFTILDPRIRDSSRIVGVIQRPSQEDGDDPGYVYVVNVVRLAVGEFDIYVKILDDPVGLVPNESIEFNYLVY